MRGRTISTFGQAFTPLAPSDGVTFVPVPPIPIPIPAVIPAEVLVLPGMDRRRVFRRWEGEVREFWIQYFVEIVGLSEAQARSRADEILEAAEQMPDQEPREFWRGYFRQVDLESRKAYLIEIDDEEILSLP